MKICFLLHLFFFLVAAQNSPKCPDSLTVTYTFEGTNPLQDVTSVNSPAVNLTCSNNCFFEFEPCPGAVGSCAKAAAVASDTHFGFPSFVLDLPGDDLTILMRVRTSDCGTGRTFLARARPGGAEIHLRCTDTGIFAVKLVDSNGNARNLNAGGRLLNDGAFHFIALTLRRSDSRVVLNYDGFTAVNSNQAASGYADPMGSWVVGAADSSGTEAFYGVEIDELMIFASSFDTTLFPSLYQETEAGRRACSNPEATTGWPLNPPTPTLSPTLPPVLTIQPTPMPVMLVNAPTAVPSRAPSPSPTPVRLSTTSSPTPAPSIGPLPSPSETHGGGPKSPLSSYAASGSSSDDNFPLTSEAPATGRQSNIDGQGPFVMQGPGDSAESVFDLLPVLIGVFAALICLVGVAIVTFVLRRRRQSVTMDHTDMTLSTSPAGPSRSRTRSRAGSASRSRSTSRSALHGGRRSKRASATVYGNTVYGNFRDVTGVSPDYSQLPNLKSSSSSSSSGMYDQFSAPETNSSAGSVPVLSSSASSSDYSHIEFGRPVPAAYDQFKPPSYQYQDSPNYKAAATFRQPGDSRIY